MLFKSKNTYDVILSLGSKINFIFGTLSHTYDLII